jgi:hypothetical protein
MLPVSLKYSVTKGVIVNRDLLPGVDRARIVRWIAIWFVIAGVLGFCAGAGLVFAGSLGSLVGAGAVAVTPGTEAGEAAAALASVSVPAIIYGIVLLILAPIRLVVAWGLFGRKRWSRMGVVIVTIVGVIDSLLGLFTGGGLLNVIIPLVIDGFLLYLFYTDAGIQEVLSN